MTKGIETYTISFKGLKEGEHTFEFVISDALFESFEEEEIHNVACKARVKLIKKSTLLELFVAIEGSLQVPCDRCLDPLRIPIDFEGDLYITFSERDGAESAELWVLDPADHEVDLKNYFYESLRISLPLQRIHPDDEEGYSTCNQEMLRRLEEHQQTDDTEEHIDPRWSELKKLMGN
ncbi:MAG: DUF177 domain-containing protein [Bacteroidales bacterium]